MFADFNHIEFDKEEKYVRDISLNSNEPYWYIIIRPKSYNDKLFSSLKIKNYYTIIERQYSNKWGDWDYPYVDPDNLNPSPNSDRLLHFIESMSYHKNEAIREYWRFHTSGQFVHFFNVDTQPYIGFHSIIHTTTKIFAFAVELGRDFKDHIFVKIQIVNIKDFCLKQDGNIPGNLENYTVYTDHLWLDPVKIDKSVLNSADRFRKDDDEIDKLARNATNSILDYFKPEEKEGHIFKEEYLKKAQDDLKKGKYIPY